MGVFVICIFILPMFEDNALKICFIIISLITAFGSGTLMADYFEEKEVSEK
jgi:hypothetical protein